MHKPGGEGISLTKALRIERGAVVSFVGGGGKTTAMFRLASELSSDGLRVVTTTTTHISVDQVRFAPASINPGELASLKKHLDQFGHCLIIGPPDGKGRVTGIALDLIAGLNARPDIDVILVEADGSRSRPFKAPGSHEPVVPEITTILAPVVGLDAIGRPLDDDNVHRPEIIASLAHQQVGSLITAETVARVLSHPEGGARQRPAGARLAPILNRADTDDAMRNAGALAGKLLANHAVDSVIISSMLQEPPVLEAWAPIAGIVLAAGQSTRYGASKQLLPWGGMTLAAHAVTVALDAGLDPVIAVLGHEAEKVAAALAGLPVRVVENAEFASGQGSSVRKGVEALPSRMGAAIFFLADQPLVTVEMVRTIVQAHRRSLASACVPVFEGQRGNPVLFDRVLFPELRELHGDTGGRELLEKHRNALVTIPASRAALLDIDTLQDYEQLTCNPD
jgi:molybdenum cofactor cytidylyltransferase